MMRVMCFSKDSQAVHLYYLCFCSVDIILDPLGYKVRRYTGFRFPQMIKLELMIKIRIVCFIYTKALYPRNASGLVLGEESGWHQRI